jgi:cytochrome oxidase assembly protein ShyY1
LGYAIQWFLLAVACVIIYFVALKRRNKTSHE